jgi:hypothetical protein
MYGFVLQYSVIQTVVNPIDSEFVVCERTCRVPTDNVCFDRLLISVSEIKVLSKSLELLRRKVINRILFQDLLGVHTVFSIAQTI